ncbi:MAG: hypothetical protein ACM3S4_02635 [Burkholderiales bacterium]
MPNSSEAGDYCEQREWRIAPDEVYRVKIQGITLSAYAHRAKLME